MKLIRSQQSNILEIATQASQGSSNVFTKTLAILMIFLGTPRTVGQQTTKTKQLRLKKCLVRNFTTLRQSKLSVIGTEKSLTKNRFHKTVARKLRLLQKDRFIKFKELLSINGSEPPIGTTLKQFGSNGQAPLQSLQMTISYNLENTV